MQFEKKSVRLGDIRPSGQNPREDFGDIGALARSIEATGGEPLNPPVVVADGNVYRIVDGERRYRALSSIYGETARCPRWWRRAWTRPTSSWPCSPPTTSAS